MTQVDRESQTQAGAVSEDAGRPVDTDAPVEAEAQGGGPSSGGTDDLHTYIGSRLRDAYNDIASQPVPDRFIELMRALDKA